MHIYAYEKHRLVVDTSIFMQVEHADYSAILGLMSNLLILQFMHKLEERLALLEHRMALLESQKVVTPERKPVEELFIDLGLVYVLSQAHNRLAYNPQFDGYDNFMEDIFKCRITNDNRIECAHKLKKASDTLLEKAADAYQKSKKK